MSLKYNVAIIDDKKLFFEEYKAMVDEFLEENGFNAEVEHIPSEQDFFSYPLEKPDLFLVDLKFGQDDKGQKFIEAIRNNYLTDVLFYSSDRKAIKKYREELGSQGIFFAERDEQNDEVEPLLQKMLSKMIAKSNAPRATRGLVMECVAELDDKIKEKILLLLNKLPEDKHDKYFKELLKIIKCSSDGRLNKLKEFFNADFANKIENSIINSISLDFDVNDLIENIHVTDSSKNLKFLVFLYKAVYGKDRVYREIIEYEALLVKRNVLAHVSQMKNGNDYIFKSRNKNTADYILSVEECLLLRKTILEIEKLLEEIKT